MINKSLQGWLLLIVQLYKDHILGGADSCEIHFKKVMVLYLSVLWGFGFEFFSSTVDAGKSCSDVLI
jgi:hypothetical protein